MDRSREPDPDLAAELRETAGREWTEEAAEDERLTELQRQRRQTLPDVIKDLVHRGERVSAEFGTQSFSGALVGTGDDFATVQASGQIADIRLDIATWSVLTTGEPPENHVGRDLSFRALLQEYADAKTKVRLALPAGSFVIGTITLIAVDHLEFSDVDQRRLFVPIDVVQAVIRSTDVH